MSYARKRNKGEAPDIKWGITEIMHVLISGPKKSSGYESFASAYGRFLVTLGNYLVSASVYESVRLSESI